MKPVYCAYYGRSLRFRQKKRSIILPGRPWICSNEVKCSSMVTKS